MNDKTTTIPDQPDGIEDDSYDLPELGRAAERVREYICANGDGVYDVIDGHPLYARDMEALRRAGAKVDELTAERDNLVAYNRAVKGANDDLRAQLTAANRRADGAEADRDSLRKGHTAYANENARLRSQLAEIATGAAEVAKTGSDPTISRALCADGIHEADGSCCNTWRSLEYIRSHYQVPAEVEGRVIANGRPGRIVGAEGTYLLIRIDGEHNPLPYHPTWEMQYVTAEATR